jgi:hypothetical protein
MLIAQYIQFTIVQLYVSGFSDMVACHSCGLTIKDWNPKDDPRIAHKTLSSDASVCSFLQMQLGGNDSFVIINTGTKAINMFILCKSLIEDFRNRKSHAHHCWLFTYWHW